MYRLVIGTRSISLVGCFVKRFADVTRIYLQDAPEDLVQQYVVGGSWRTAQLYLLIDHDSGDLIMETGLKSQVSELILEIDNGHHTLWSRKKAEEQGRRQEWPMVEINFLPTGKGTKASSSEIINIIRPQLR